MMPCADLAKVIKSDLIDPKLSLRAAFTEIQNPVAPASKEMRPCQHPSILSKE